MTKKRKTYFNKELVKSINSSIVGAVNNIAGINLKNYMLLNGTIDNENSFITEYIYFKEEDYSLNFIQVDSANITNPTKISNDILTVNMRLYKSLKVLKVTKLSEIEFDKYLDATIDRISKHFCYNVYGGLGVSIDYINSNYNLFKENDSIKLNQLANNTSNEILFSPNISNTLYKKLIKCNNIEDIYNITSK